MKMGFGLTIGCLIVALAACGSGTDDKQAAAPKPPQGDTQPRDDQHDTPPNNPTTPVQDPDTKPADPAADPVDTDDTAPETEPQPEAALLAACQRAWEALEAARGDTEKRQRSEDG